MPRLCENKIMDPHWGLKYIFEERKIQIKNDLKRVVGVSLDDSRSLTGVDPGHCATYYIAKDTVRVTLCYYNKNREMENLCTALLLNNGKMLCVRER